MIIKYLSFLIGVIWSYSIIKTQSVFSKNAGLIFKIFITKDLNAINIEYLIDREKQFGLNEISTYNKFQQQIIDVKQNVTKFFSDEKVKKKKIIGYGAAAKGNTFLNYCNIENQLIDYVVDISPHKQGLYLPGTHIPIFHPDKIKETKPDYVIILAWNLKEEIMEQLKFIKEWNGKFVVFLPEMEII